MEVNVTLVLQLLQFGVAYYFLYNFVFVPAFQILSDTEQSKNMLYKKLELEHREKEHLLQKYHAQNKSIKDTLLDLVPEQITQTSYLKSDGSAQSYEIQSIEVSEQEKKDIELLVVDSLSQVIKK